MFKQIGDPARFICMGLLIVVCFLVLPTNAKNKGFVTIATLGPSPITLKISTLKF